MPPEEISALARAIAQELSQQSSHQPGCVDWSRVRVDAPLNARPQCGKLDDVTHFKLTVIANILYEGSLAKVIQTAVHCYLSRTWDKHCDKFKAVAAREGITVEEYISRIVDGTLKP